MVTSQNTIVVHSPHSGRSAFLPEALAYAEQAGIHIVQVIPISEIDGLPAQGSSWRAMGIDIAIAAGGDGLVGGVITHIAESDLPLGILPLGTSNDIARSLGIPLDTRIAAEAIVYKAKELEVDLVDVYSTPQEQEFYGIFSHALTVGLNVQFARLVTDVRMRRRFRRWTYHVAVLKMLRSMRFVEALEIELRFEGLVLPSLHRFQSDQMRLRLATREENITKCDHYDKC